MAREPVMLEDVLEFIGGFGPWQMRVTGNTLWLSWICIAMQTISVSFTSPLLPRDWFNESDEIMKQEKGFLVIAYFLGWSVGCSLAGKWGDELGRVQAYWRLKAICFFGGLLTALMPEFYTYTAARCIAGCGAGGWGIVTWVMASEFWGEGYRNCLGCVCHIPYCIGLALFPALIWPMTSLDHEPGMWRFYALVPVFPLIPYFCYAWMPGVIPESPRWLLTNSRVDEAVAILEEGAKKSGRPLPVGWCLQGVVKARRQPYYPHSIRVAWPLRRRTPGDAPSNQIRTGS